MSQASTGATLSGGEGQRSQSSTMTVLARLSASARASTRCTSTEGYRCSSFMQVAKSPCARLHRRGSGHRAGRRHTQH